MTQEQRGLSTRSMLVATLVLVISSITVSSLLVIRSRIHRQVLDDFSQDLTHSVETFQNLESQRLASLERENALLADLPSLKALMTTSDRRTIADGAIEFWKVGDNDLFALASSDGHVVAAYARGYPGGANLGLDLERALGQSGRHYLLSGDRLFEYSVRPLFFGSQETGTLLGYVVSGYVIDADFLRQVNQSSAAEISFLAGGHVISSTLAGALRLALERSGAQFANRETIPATISLGSGQYLMVADDLSADASVPLRLVVMKSFDHAEKSQHEINRLLVLVGFFTFLAGTVLMLTVSSMVTRPLERLAKSVRAFGTGRSEIPLPLWGTREVRELGVAFAAMREEILETNRALLEAERLATIGRMASSVSHDLRHYLAAVYANAEFLASGRPTDLERADLFNDIRMAVHGTTELIDSLLIFSRTNSAAPRTSESIATLVERAIAMVKNHPDAEHVLLRALYDDAPGTAAVVDSKQMQRAIYNLLLNACQAARGNSTVPHVTAAISASGQSLAVTITDDGPGVSLAIRENLFEPFVSAGKQNGTGLGLTLAQCVAEEHGGSVQLASSRPGETVFILSIARGLDSTESSDVKYSAKVGR